MGKKKTWPETVKAAADATRKHAMRQIWAPDADAKMAASQAPNPTTVADEFALDTVNADVVRTVAHMTGVVGFFTSMGALRSAAEFCVGPISVVVSDGAIDGVRFGPHASVEHLDGIELLEIGAFLYSLGITLRKKEVAGSVAAAAAVKRNAEGGAG